MKVSFFFLLFFLSFPTISLVAFDHVSLDSGGMGGLEGNEFPSISGSGRYVLFTTENSFVPEDADATFDAYLYDRQEGTMILVSKGSDGASADASASAEDIVEIAGEVFVLFTTSASNIMDSQPFSGTQLYLRNISSGVNKVISRSSSGDYGDGSVFSASFSSDGESVVFISGSTNLVEDDENNVNDIFLRIIDDEKTIRVSLSDQREELDGSSQNCFVSADGSFVAFSTGAENISVDDKNGTLDVYRVTVASGAIVRISNGEGGDEPDQNVFCTGISDDGNWVSFNSRSTNLVDGDTNGVSDGFVYNVAEKKTTRVSVSSGSDEMDGTGAGVNVGALSDDGAFYVFSSISGNLVEGDTNERADTFRHRIESGTTERVSLTPTGGEQDESSGRVAVNSDGSVIAYESRATNVAASANTNGTKNDIFTWPGTPQIVPTVAFFNKGNDAEKAKLIKKIRKLKKKLKQARRGNKIAKVKKFKKKIKKLSKRLKLL